MSAELAQTGWLQQNTEGIPAGQAGMDLTAFDVGEIASTTAVASVEPVIESGPRWRRLAKLGAIIGSTITAAVALAPAMADAKIVVGEGIAGVKLGQTAAQVRSEAGPPWDSSNATDGSFDWTYAIIGSKIPQLSEVFFTPKGKVDSISTESPKEGTSKGIGMGAQEARIKKAYPSIVCKVVQLVPGISLTQCKLPSQYQGESTITEFVLSKQHPDFEHFANSSIERVNQIDVYVAPRG